MKNKTILYLSKEKDSAALKGAATRDYFGDCLLGRLESGKPIIINPQGYFISVSHSGGVTAVVISDTPVGLDIEEIREIDFEKIKKGFFSDEDAEKITDLNSFFEFWVKKEAESKISGEGIFKSRKKDISMIFTSLSREISTFAEKSFSGTLAADKTLSFTIRKM